MQRLQSFSGKFRDSASQTWHPWKSRGFVHKESRKIKQQAAFSQILKFIESPLKQINYSNFCMRIFSSPFRRLRLLGVLIFKETGGVAVHSKHSLHYCRPCPANKAQVLSRPTSNNSQPISQHVLGSRLRLSQSRTLRRGKFLTNYEIKLLDFFIRS